jgi:ankyrin repeat protein
LQAAAISNGINSARVLVSFGADISYKNFQGETPLFLASSYGADEVMKYFIEELKLSPYSENYTFE